MSDQMRTMEEFLVDRGLISPADLKTAKHLQKETDERFCSALRRTAVLQGNDLAKAVAEYYGLPLATPDDWPQSSAYDRQFPLSFLRNKQVFPLADTKEGIVLAMADPGDSFALDAIRLATEREVIPKVAAIEEIDAAIERVTREDDASDDWTNPAKNDYVTDDVEHLRDLALGTPVVRLVNQLIQDAMHARATDIHIEPFDGRLCIRMRVDGMLRDVRSPPLHMAKAIASRIKILAGLNIAERRLPQDGRARVRLDGRQLDLRVATMPTIHGETVAIRLLDCVRRLLDLSKLGYKPSDEKVMRRKLAAPHGLFIVTGPTGSGKTTTLAASLSILNESRRKILTIEDPIEYEIEGVNQTQAKPDIGLTFASALRSFLRHDPDVIMVGEMRDNETAQIGIHAALTGHLVLTTLHTNTAAGAVTRLLDMGVDAYLLASSLNCVVGQRLVRLLCSNCREAYSGRLDFPAPALIAAGLDPNADEKLWRTAGCDHCFGTGYRDRIAITEILDVSEDIRKLIIPGISAPELEAAARDKGMITMMADGVIKCIDGLTTPEEVRRVALEL